MKTYIFLLLSIGLFSCNNQVKNTKSRVEEAFVIKRGLNASHWLSQSEIRGDDRVQYMQAKDFKKIADMGFDHVRLPIDEMQMWDEEGNRLDEAFELMHFAIKECLKNDLRVIVDLHILRSHHFNELDDIKLWNDKTAQEDFIKFWVELSTELKKYPNSMVAYEPMNEAVAPDPEDWNKLINWVIAEIRKLEPERTIIMGSNRWQSASTFKYLNVPKGDTNIILSFHFYEPMPFTHYKAYWTPFSKLDVETEYPGWALDTVKFPINDEKLKVSVMYGIDYYTKDTLENHIMQAVEVADKLNLQLYCGEFGCFPTTTMEQRAVWYNDIIDIFNRNNVAWAHWNYKNDFPVVDAKTLEPIDEIISIMMK